MVSVPYASAIGSLMYAMVYTRPDIAHAMGIVSKYMSNSGKQHSEAMKWILRKSTTGYIYTLDGTAVSWVSKLQKIVALSTTKA
ncbi:secreted RxLR effector protein 161-like [Aristolochia californica]|uniref:secreted RxLR effector protein 161-like n=1 Tax=Aristolochia californica TaxID=171875 RepID=UPI0035D80E39